MAPADGLTITILGFVLSVCLVAIYIIRYRMSPRRSPARRFAVREGKVLRVAVGVMLNLIISTYAFHYIVLLRVTPTANRNSYRVARLVGARTQGSVLRPQPWAGESQLRQSCCCLRAAVYMYSFRCCYLRAALHMYSLRCCRLEGPGCVSHPPFIATIRE